MRKQINNSFITNHDLIQVLRNKSFEATKQNSTRLHTNKSKISLLQKKSYDRLYTENSSYVGNVSQFTPNYIDKAAILIQDCIATLGQSNHKILHKLKKVLTYIR